MLAPALTLAIVGVLGAAQRKPDPCNEVRKAVAASASALMRRDLKGVKSDLAPGFKAYDYRGRVVDNAYLEEQVRRMFDQSRSIKVKCTIKSIRWDGKAVTCITQSDGQVVLDASGHTYRWLQTTEDQWKRFNGRFLEVSSKQLFDREWLDGRPMHGGTIQ